MAAKTLSRRGVTAHRELNPEDRAAVGRKQFTAGLAVRNVARNAFDETNLASETSVSG
jgi:hypothetical protein